MPVKTIACCFERIPFSDGEVRSQSSTCSHKPTTNNGVVANGEDASGQAADYYGVLQKILEYTFGGNKELKVLFFECNWFDPINSTRADDFGMVEVKHKSCYLGNNLLFAHSTH
jgi:hypothetical protein